ncbi:hypothetical protein [Flavobacterium sp. FlaQc-30]|uniref:hypothetical protein n=1 Tax=Flavobacterium sp. FlaQc-30 TaxID=3374179 RepID=UPI0037582907
MRAQTLNNLIIMLKTILNFKGVEVLSREEQKNFIGGSYRGPFQDICTTPCAMIISPNNPCFIDACQSIFFPGPDPSPEPLVIVG